MAAAEQRADERVAEAENTRDYKVEVTENKADAKMSEVSALENKVEMSEDRQVYTTEARTRLQKIDIRLDEAEAKADIKDESSRIDFDNAIKAAKDERAEIENDFEGISEVPDESWDDTVARMNDKLDSLENRVDELIDMIEEA